MIQQNEVVTLVLGVAALVFVRLYYSQIRRLPCACVVVAALCVSMVGWVATNVEALVWGKFFQVVEHLCYGCCGVLVAVWSWCVFRSRASR